MINNLFITQENGLWLATAYLVGSEGTGRTVELQNSGERQIYTDIEGLLGVSSVSTQFLFSDGVCTTAIFSGETGGTFSAAELAVATGKISELQTLIEGKL